MSNTKPGMSAAHKRLGLQKWIEVPCLTCGAPRQKVNGKWLGLEREVAGYTMREWARKLGYSAAYICDIEHNRRGCSPTILAAYEALR